MKTPRTANPRRVRFAAALSVPLLVGVSVFAAPAASATALYYASDSSSSSTSSDWAGWDVTGDTYTSVAASWTVPTVTCAADETSYSADWIGLDGDGSESVEQIGTSSDCDSGVATYSSWYEFYPASSVALANKVSAGDKMSATVKSDGNGDYTLTLVDHTKGWTATKTGTAAQAENASAEIITEAPSSGRTESVLPLADFGTTTFTDITVDGKKLSTYDSARKIDMGERSGTVKASTSDLTSAGGFSVTWKSAGSTTSTSSGFGGGSGGSGSGGGWPGSSSGTGSSGSGTGTSGGWPSSNGWPMPEVTTDTGTWVLTPGGWMLVSGSSTSSDSTGSSTTSGTSTDDADPSRDWLNSAGLAG